MTTSSGSRYRSSSILVSRAMHNTKLYTLTILSNTCNVPLYYASTCTLCVDPLQAWSTKYCGRRSTYGKICSIYIYSRINVRIIPPIWYFVIWASTTSTAVYNSICMTLCTEHVATCSIVGTTVTVFFLCSSMHVILSNSEALLG